MRARRLSARWVVPVEGDPIECGAVLIGPDGRIVAVGPDALVPAPPDVPAESFPDAVLVPGFVNTHTHLELTGLDGRVTASAFPEWIRGVREAKAARTPDVALEAARQGVADCFAAGVTTVADTGDSGAPARALAEAGGSGVVYQEVFGPHPDQEAESLAGLQAAVERLGAWAGGRIRLGVSPHAPYTVSGPLYRSVAAWARSAGLPLAVHVAESAAESDLLRDGTGGFAEAWRRRGIPLPPPGRSPVAWLDEHGVLGPDTLCIHAIRVDASDVARLARSGAAVAHCPRANAAHGHGDAPLAVLLAAGLRVGVGTDSVVSLAPTDLLADTRRARELAGLDASAALELCTIGAARALGLDAEIGSLRPGKWGDCVALAVPAASPDRSPADLILDTGPADVLATFLAGRPVYRSSPHRRA